MNNVFLYPLAARLPQLQPCGIGLRWPRHKTGSVGQAPVSTKAERAMTQAQYFRRLMILIVLAVGLAALLYIGFGPHLFSFYGWAAVGLVIAIALSRTLRSRYTAQGVSRWPRLLFLIPAALTCLIQIGYWLAFFNLGASGVLLGPPRLMLLNEIGFLLLPALALLLLIAAYLVWRGVAEPIKKQTFSSP